MHSGFGALRSACGMNIEADLSGAGQLIWRDKPAVRADVARIAEMWRELLAEHGGPMLFGEFSIADAYFAPVCMRLKTFALPVPAEITAYVQRVCALPGVQAWIDGALAEKDFLDFEEPYRLKPE
jgi:glutathione S-transferase